MFNTQGWIGFYIVGVILNLFISFVSTVLSHFLVGESSSYVMVRLGISGLQILVTSFFYMMAYTKATILFVNKTMLEGKKFSTKLGHFSFFLFVFSNILVCIFTLGIYTPWAYKAIIDKLAESIESEDGGHFSFLSKASALFSVFVISLSLIIITCVLSMLSFVVAINFYRSFAVPFVLIGLVLFTGFLASVVAMKVFIFNWLFNFSYMSPNKKSTYLLNINTTSAVFFYLGQLVLVMISLGFYAGAYMVNIYDYFVNKIEERVDGELTGRLIFLRPFDRGAGFLLLQVILCVLTAGIYTPFAYVEYARFFVNNTYLYTATDERKDEQEEGKDKQQGETTTANETLLPSSSATD